MHTTLKEKPLYCRSCLKAWYDHTEIVTAERVEWPEGLCEFRWKESNDGDR